MQLIFEGPNGVGKTTVILEWLRTRPGWEYQVVRYNGNLEQVQAYFNMWCAKVAVYSNDYERDVVYDRGHISETVYAPLFRKPHVNEYWPKVLLTKMNHIRQNVAIVYITEHNRALYTPQTEETASLRDLEIPLFHSRVFDENTLPVIELMTQTAYGWRPVEQVVLELESRVEELRAKQQRDANSTATDVG